MGDLIRDWQAPCHSGSDLTSAVWRDGRTHAVSPAYFASSCDDLSGTLLSAPFWRAAPRWHWRQGCTGHQVARAAMILPRLRRQRAIRKDLRDDAGRNEALSGRSRARLS